LEDSPQRGSRPRSGIALLASAGNIKIHSVVQSRFSRQVSETSVTSSYKGAKDRLEREESTHLQLSSFYVCALFCGAGGPGSDCYTGQGKMLLMIEIRQY